MLFAEPATTKLDLKFTLAGFPVRVHPLFWVVTLLLALNGPTTLERAGLWMVGSFFSILVHELGHALAFRRYGWQARITLHAMGGLASPGDRYSFESPTRKQMIIISAAGPIAGFVLAALLIVVLLRLDYEIPFLWWTFGSGAPIPEHLLQVFVADLLFINVIWGLMNLLPVHPLDGGQIAREIFSKKDPESGLRKSLRISIAAGIIAALAGAFAARSVFITLLFGYLALMSYVALLHYEQRKAPTLSQLARRLRGSIKRRRSKRIERTTQELVREQDRTEDDGRATPELEQSAQDLLTSLTAEIRRERRARDEADS